MNLPEPTPTIAQDVITVADWLFKEFAGMAGPLWNMDADAQEYWLGRARELISSNTGTGAISVHFVARDYAEEVQKAIRRDFTNEQLEEIDSFGELQRHCDANVYLIEHGPEMDDDYTEVSLCLINAITDVVDRWLREKGWKPTLSEGVELGCNTFDFFGMTEDERHKEIAVVSRDTYKAVVVSGRPETDKEPATAEGYTVAWTDFVANHWGEHYTTLSTALARLAVLEQAVVDETVDFQDPPEFAKTAQQMLANAHKEAQ